MSTRAGEPAGPFFSPMTEKELAKLYTRYNKKYFDGKLPDTIPVVFVDMSKTENGGLCTTYHEQGLVPLHTIYLDSTFKEYNTLLKMFLLHEMAHAKLYPSGAHDDGKEEQAFDEEMMRLAFRGALHKIW